MALLVHYLEVDVLANIVAITPEPGQTQEAARHYGYDALSRLTEVRDAKQAPIEAFGYDPTGNRTTKTWQGAQQSYVYAPGSHWLLDTGTDQRTYDAAGNMVQRTQGRTEFGYEHGAHNRYQRHLVNGAEIARYAYNGHGERTCAWVGETLTRFVYDTGGRLLGEYQASGKPIIEYVYLGDLPVAAFATHGLVYIETDHLGTPRVVVDAATNATLWHWPLTGRAFGEHDPVAPAQEGNAPFVFGLRYPGQRADGESGLHYNYFRDYESGTGRYIQSDPIGLSGGKATFAYVLSNPFGAVDPTGEAAGGLLIRAGCHLLDFANWITSSNRRSRVRQYTTWHEETFNNVNRLCDVWSRNCMVQFEPGRARDSCRDDSSERCRRAWREADCEAKRMWDAMGQREPRISWDVLCEDVPTGAPAPRPRRK